MELAPVNRPGIPGAPMDDAQRPSPARFVRQNQAAVWRYLRLLGAQPADAEDLTQETFLRFLARHEPDGSSSALLRAIARGLWVDQQRWYQRRRVRDHVERIEELVADPGTDLLDDRWLAALGACRETLAEKARTALDLRYRDQKSRAALAATLGMSPHGARNLLARARETLKTCIERRLAAEESR